MLLAEALIERADLQKKISGLRQRMGKNAKVQDGEKPAEKIEELLQSYESAMSELETLIQRINRTNAATPLAQGTLQDAIASRDCLRAKIAAYQELYNAAAIQQDRFTRSEIKYVRLIDAVNIQKTIDELSKQFRLLDTAIQSTNWQTELLN